MLKEPIRVWSKYTESEKWVKIVEAYDELNFGLVGRETKLNDFLSSICQAFIYKKQSFNYNLCMIAFCHCDN